MTRSAIRVLGVEGEQLLSVEPLGALMPFAMDALALGHKALLLIVLMLVHSWPCFFNFFYSMLLMVGDCRHKRHGQTSVSV